MITLYFHPLSFPALTTLFTAQAAGVDYESVVIDLATGEHKKPEFLAINPFGRVPALTHGDYKLAESSAIIRYIAKLGKSSLYPDDAKTQGTIDQWSDFVVHHVRTNVARVQFNRVLAPMFGMEPDKASLAMGLKFLEGSLPIVEARLSDSPFLAGDSITLADMSLIAALEPAKMAGLDMEPYPKLMKWLTARRSETFYTNVHSHFGAELGM
ncbi:MAG: glutathione S-transferase N-terminal domain-containing protein [Robiginitomaculum sp.]